MSNSRATHISWTMKKVAMGNIDEVCEGVTAAGKRAAEEARPGLFPELAPPAGAGAGTGGGVGVVGAAMRRRLSSTASLGAQSKVAPTR